MLACGSCLDLSLIFCMVYFIIFIPLHPLIHFFAVCLFSITKNVKGLMLMHEYKLNKTLSLPKFI